MSNLTPYDTGEVLEPHVWDMSDEDADFGYGFVDFDDDEGTTICMVRTTRRRGGGYILVVEDHSTGTETSVVVGE